MLLGWIFLALDIYTGIVGHMGVSSPTGLCSIGLMENYLGSSLLRMDVLEVLKQKFSKPHFGCGSVCITLYKHEGLIYY